MKKRFSLLLAILSVGLLVLMTTLGGLFSQGVSAQIANQDDDADIPAFARGVIEKDEYLRMRDAYIDELRGLPYKSVENPRIKAIREMEDQIRRMGANINNQTWMSVGPEPIPNGQTGTASSASGRVTAIAVHPTNPNIVYVGAAQGGVFRTLDGGLTWRAIFDSALSLAIGAIAIDPSNPSTVWVGTGEPNGSCDSYSGVGLYRITNADTLPVLAGPFNQDGSAADVMTGRAIGKIVIHPTDSNTIFVSTVTGIGGISCDLPSQQPSRGLFRSTNATAANPTFTKLTVATANSGNRAIIDIAMEPGAPDNLLCTVLGLNGVGDGGVYRSTNATTASPTFTRTLTLGTASATIRGQLAINKVLGVTTVYLAAGDNSGAATCGTNGTLRKSTDGGQTWSAPIAAGSGFCGGQCFYNVSLAVDPNNASNVILGGNVFGSCTKLLSRSTDGGVSFVDASAAIHADNHVAMFAPSNPSIAYAGTDGGIYRSTNGGLTWASINVAGFNATQFQSLALHPTDREFMIGGTQDNGTQMKKADGTWTRADFGDGGFSLIDQNAADTSTVTMYHTYFNQVGAMGLARVTTTAAATDNGWTFFGCGFGGSIPNGLNCSDTAVLFYAPLALGPGNPNTVYFGSDRLYRSTNQGATMTVVSQQFPLVSATSDRAVTAIGISPQDDNVRIVGLRNGKVFATTTGANPMTEVTGTISARYITRAVIDPNTSTTAYVTLGGFGLATAQHVWKTTNLNSPTPTWIVSGNGIPDVPVNAFVIDPQNSSILFAGTDIGVYRSIDGGANWSPYSTGLPRVAVFDMAIQNTNRVLRIATHGRGIWEISVSPFNLNLFSASYAANGGNGSVTVAGPNGPSWTATTSDSWIMINNAGPGTGNGSVTYTVTANSASTNRIGTITIANQTFTVYQGASFADVPPSHIFYDLIGKLSAHGITTGCGGGNYCPDDPVTREQMAAFIIRARGDFNPLTPPSQRFADVPPSSPFYNFIDQMAVLGITSGCGGGNYCPSTNVTREQMAAFIIRGIGEFNPPPPASQRFADVPPSNPFYNFIDRMGALNITSGCGGGNYCPSDNVTRGQMAVFLVRAFGL
jgi:S-layer homology domain/Putative binding domain, N-terminal